jgi:hypothetical protein
MTDDRSIVRAYSQDRQTYRHNSISVNRKSSIEIQRTSENYYSNRNCPEILSVFAFQNRHLDGRQKQIYQSASNNEHYFNMINYPIQSRTATPNLVLQNINTEEKETKLPKVTSRVSIKILLRLIICFLIQVTSSNVKKFSTLTSKSSSTVRNKDPIPAIRTSVKSVSSSINKSPQAKMPIVSNNKKPNTRLSHMCHVDQIGNTFIRHH